ncbi:protein of unknown function DUF3343 [Geotalea daltonii FRC-32]|uniref:Putative Se/S carrier protein-like domain-containing protein n=1 Tax=Geotalea daltonii (strain DSM 22248 / JCM 15807 / FRC-32) TaxID=316067 RepID=B9M588_GEODF|nr:MULTISPECIES: DUF3343 domain-containing protein [Geotalea]ACM19843.1 protein of unknown function DUF3343 [Geotalea daltonii FRC-32]
MVQDGDYVAVFNSIHRVMKAEKILKQRKMAILLIPVPRALQSDCGLAIRYQSALRQEVEAVLSEEGLLPAELYAKQKGQFVRVLE